MGLFSGGRKTNATVGLYADETGVAIARVGFQRARQPVLLASEFEPGARTPSESALDSLARQAGAAGECVNVVLTTPDYQLLLVEAPEVDPDELRSAVRWRVKDLIDFHIDDAVFDVFAIPEQHNRPRGQAQMYAVAARASRIGALVDQIETTTLKLEAIDITELAMRNLAALTEADARGTVLLHFTERGGVLTITHQHELFVTRRFDLGTTDLSADSEGRFDQVLLEIQRSIDYYGSHFTQPAPVALMLLPGFEGVQPLSDWLDGQLDLEVGVFDITRTMDCGKVPGNRGIGHQLLAIGGALRREERSL